jgi:uncharacterized membrane protein
MTGGTGYAFAAMLCFGLGDFIYKRSAQGGVPAHYFIMLQAWCFCPLVILYAVATESLVLRPAALWGCLAGLFIFIGFYNFVRSLTIGAVSINAPIFRMNFIVTVLLAVVLLGEPLTRAKVFGLVLSLAATWLLLGGGRDLPTGEAGRRSLGQVALATFSFGAANFFHKLGLLGGMPPETMLSAQAIVFITCATLFAYYTDRAIRPPAWAWAYAVPAALVLIIAFLLFLNALTLGHASVLVPIAQMGFVPAAALGVLVLNEPLTGRKIIGLAIALAALAVLAAS